MFTPHTVNARNVNSHVHTNHALPSPNGSGPSTARSRRQGANLVANGPLSARGINPDRHPALHEKELAEMTRLVKLHCQDAAEVVNRSGVKCLWCQQIFMCPPYRPQSFYFKDVAGGSEHDGHYWCCPANPNVSLQAGRGLPVGDGKVLI